MQQELNPEMMKNATTIKCEECGCENFEEILKLKKLSKLHTGSQKDTLIPIPVFGCKNCGHVNSEFDME